MATPLQKGGEVHPSIFSRVPPRYTIDDAIKQDLAVANDCLGSREQALVVVETTWEQLDTTRAAQTDNRRSHYEAEEKRGQYKPFTHDEFLRRRLLLDSIRRCQIRNEGGRRTVDQEYDIQCLCLEIALLVMHHNAFYAAVAMTRIIAAYTADATLNIYYHSVIEDTLNAGKDASSVSRIEDAFAKVLLKRFGRRIRLKAGSKTRFQRIRPNELQIQALRYWLLRFLPRIPDTTLGFPPINIGSQEGAAQMKPVESLLDMELFNSIADDLKISQLEDCLELPLIADEDPGGYLPNEDPRGPQQKALSKAGAFASDIARVKRGIFNARKKRASIHPRELAIYVDDTFKCVLNDANDACALQFEETSRIITLAANDSKGDAVTLATHVLIHDRPKEESWKATIPWMGKVVCALRFMDCGVVEALFVLTDKLPSLGIELVQSAGTGLISSSVALVKATHTRAAGYVDGSPIKRKEHFSKSKAKADEQFPQQLALSFPDQEQTFGGFVVRPQKEWAVGPYSPKVYRSHPASFT